MFKGNSVVRIFLLTAALVGFSTQARQVNGQSGYEFTPYIGYVISSDIGSDNSGDVELSNDAHIGFGLAWQDSPNGQGQILVNYVTHDFDNVIDGSSEDLKLLYAHFNGIAQFRQHNYVTTFSIGLGGTYMDSDYESGLYPSATVAFGTRYEFSPFFALTTELRSYITLTDEDEDFFCKNSVCAAQFDDALYIDNAISIGLAFAF